MIIAVKLLEAYLVGLVIVYGLSEGVYVDLNRTLFKIQMLLWVIAILLDWVEHFLGVIDGRVGIRYL